MLTSPAAVPMPEVWFDGGLPELHSVRDVARALRSEPDRQEVVRAVVRGDEGTARKFHDQVFAALDSVAAHVEISFPVEVPSPVACTLFAVWLGVAAEMVHDDVGGSVSHVISGVGHRHDQAWHTDSTPWLLPNRYTLLGSLKGQDATTMPTGVLPLRFLQDALMFDQEALAALRGEALPWRVNFPDLPQLWSAILDPVVPRWVLPAVEPLVDRMSSALARGVEHIQAVLAADELEWYGPATSDGRLVMFDNHRVLHRGPSLERDCGRELLRVKVGGKAVV